MWRTVSADVDDRGAMHIILTVRPDADRARRQVRAAMRIKFRRLYVLGVVLIAAGIAMVAANLPSGYAPLAIGAVLLALPWLLPRAAAKARTGVFAELATYELTEHNVLARTPSLSNGFTWEAVERVEDTGEFWVVMVKRVGVLVLPWTLLPAA